MLILCHLLRKKIENGSYQIVNVDFVDFLSGIGFTNIRE